MELIALVASCAGLAAVGVTGLRWLRVAQREHYIASSCTAVARRWITRRSPNQVLPAIGVGCVLGAVAWAGSGVGAGPGLLAVAAAASACAFPFPMTILGREVKLNPTRRLRTLGAIVVGLGVIVIVVAALMGRAFVGPALVALLMPLLVDVACALAQPVERRSLDGFRRKAETRLAEVAPRVIAVTGSWGKTSTKNHIRDLLGATEEVVISPASWNNMAGLSRTVNEHLTDTCDVLVAEMGMYGPGEIREMCAWLRPEIAVICALGPMHLERVGSIAGIVAAKAEIFEGARVGVLWVDEPHLAKLADELTGIEVWRVGTSGGANLDVEVRTDGHDHDDNSRDIVLSFRGAVLGSYPAASGVHAGNAACAAAAALAAGAEPVAVGAALPQLGNPAHRALLTRTEQGVWLIDDTFNSNPQGAAAALESLVRAAPSSKRVVVTPGMIELGPIQYAENRAFAERVVASGSILAVVGWINRRALIDGAGSGAVRCFATREAAREWVRATLGDGDGVLWENDLPDHYP